MSYIPFQPNKIYIESDVLNHPMTNRIVSRLPKVIHTVVEDITRIEFTPQEQPLILAQQKGKFLKRCPGTQKYICCGYRILNLINNCELNCSYCILQGYFNSRHIIIYVNIDDLFQELEELFNSSPDRIFRIGTGELADSLSTDHLTEYSKSLVSFFADKQN